MLVLYETAAGYALFKLVDDGKMEKPEEIYKDFETTEKANQAYVEILQIDHLDTNTDLQYQIASFQKV